MAAAREASTSLLSLANARVRADTSVTLLIDQSGSMRDKMLLAAATVDIAQEFLDHLGCAVEVLGFTTSSWKGGEARKRWAIEGRKKDPGRLCDLLHLIYHASDQPRPVWDSEVFRQMVREDLRKESVDGEALQWAAERLRNQSTSLKLLIVISDGAPADESTLVSNDAGFLHRHLCVVISRLKSEDNVRVAAVGIGYDVSYYYANSARVDDIDDLAIDLIDLLQDNLRDMWRGFGTDKTSTLH